MKVNRKELVEVLSRIKPGLAKKELIEQATHFIFCNGEAVTFSDQICLIHPFVCDFNFSVKAEEFTKIIDGMSEEEFDMSLEDGILSIKSKSTKAKLSTIVDETAKVEHLIAVIKQEIAAPDFFKPLPKEFLDAIYLCAFSANKDMATGVRSCVAVKDDQVCSTDNLRVSSYIMDGKVQEMLIPAKDAIELTKYKVVDYGVSDNWLHFRTKSGIVFNCKCMKGEYPYGIIESLISQESANVELPSSIGATAASLSSLTEGDQEINKAITISVEPGKVTLKAEKERGWVEKIVPFEYKGEPFTFMTNPNFFAQIMNHATKFILLDGVAQFESDNFVHVMSLPEA